MKCKYDHCLVDSYLAHALEQRHSCTTAKLNSKKLELMRTWLVQVIAMEQSTANFYLVCSRYLIV